MTRTKLHALLAFALSATFVAAQSTIPSEFESDRFPSLKTGGNCLIKGGRVYTITGKVIDGGDVLVKDGRIAAVGVGLTAPDGFVVIDAKGLHVLPGIVDAHSHRGQDSTNEGSDATSPETNMREVLNPYHVGLYHYLAGGITSGLALHGSANSIGGESVVFKSRFGASPEEMIFDGAPRMVKFALGENPKRAGSGNQPGKFPATRMGVEAVIRRSLDDALKYKDQMERASRAGGPKPRFDYRLQTLVDILDRKVWVQCHSYRQDEMLMIVRLSQEYGFKIGSMQHALEGYKIAPELAAAGVPASIFGDYWSYKMEVTDVIPMAASLLIRAGVVTSVNTDTFAGLAPLNLDAAKALRYGISEADALKLLTINPAKQLGIDRRVGSLEAGKDADISIWRGHPLSVYSRCVKTLVDGEIAYERRDAMGVDAAAHVSDTVVTNTLTADKAPLGKASSVYVIFGGTVHPVSGPAIPNGTVVIRDGKIAAVGAGVAIPSGAVKVNAKGQHVYPGLIDAGSELGLNEVPPVVVTVDNAERGLFEPDLKAIVAMNPESEHLPIARSFGITTALVQPSGSLISGTGTVVNLSGANREQMAILPSGAPGLPNPLPPATLHVQWPDAPAFAVRATMKTPELKRSLDQIRNLRLYIREYFETARRYDEMRTTDPLSAVDTRLEAMLPFVRGRRSVVFNTNTAEGILSAVKLGKELGLKTIIARGAEAWKVGAELATADVPVIYAPPTATNPETANGFAEFDPWDSQLAAPARMKRAGVKFAFGSFSSAQSFNLPNSVGWTCGYGLSPADGVRSMTLDAAEILGISDRYGSLEPGKVANVIITSGDPLEISTNVQAAFIGGKPVSLESKFTRLYRKYEARLTR